MRRQSDVMRQTLCALAAALLFLVSAALPCASAEGADAPQLSRGSRWVRSHPFQIYAAVEFPVNMKTYRKIGFTSLIANFPTGFKDWPARIFGRAEAEGLDWHWFYTWKGKNPEETFFTQMRRLRREFKGNIGLSVGDENDYPEFPMLGRVLRQVREEVDEDTLVYHCMRGGSINAEYDNDHSIYKRYLEHVRGELKPDVIMPNHYPFHFKGTSGQFFRNLGVIRELALKTRVPYWNWLQAFTFTDRGGVNPPSESQVRFQAFTSLAYGYSGLGFWSYANSYPPYTYSILDKNGDLSHIGRSVKGALPELKNLGTTIKGLTSTSVWYVPGRVRNDGKWTVRQPSHTERFANDRSHPLLRAVQHDDNPRGVVLGFFVDDDGRDYAMIVNANHGFEKTAAETATAVTVTFSQAFSRLDRLDRLTGEFVTVPLDQHSLLGHRLPGGTGDLFRLPAR